tara:strand:- start:255 stop:557 length:303 start_codon:yes stop_codon:yes gene_type:complete
MKKIIFSIFVCTFLNSCAEYTTLVGPSYTMANTGSVIKAGSSFAAGYTVRKITEDSYGDVFTNKSSIRTCKIEHSSHLSKIFFETIDEIDCVRNHTLLFQ